MNIIFSFQGRNTKKFLFLVIKFDVIISKYRQNLSVRFKQLRQKQLEGLEMIFSIDCIEMLMI